MQANPDKVPFYSIVMATYNRSHMITRAIESVINQEYENWELIVVDDGSDDDTSAVVHKYKDARIQYLFQDNRGRSAARNVGVELSQGKMLCFLDDDDWYYPHFLIRMHDFIEKKGAEDALYFCAQDQYDQEGNKVGESGRWYDNDPVKYVLLSANNIEPVVFPRRVMEHHRFDERFEIGEDFHFLLPIVLSFPVHYCEERLLAYKIHEGSTMEREFSDKLIDSLPYNRLDVMQDLWDKYQDELRKSGHHYLFLKKFNKIRYFYASAWMQQGRIQKSLILIKQIDFINLKSVYYFLSIYTRSFHHIVLSLVRN